MTLRVVRAKIREYWHDELAPQYMCTLHYERPTGRVGRAYGYGDTPYRSYLEAKNTATFILAGLSSGQYRPSIPAQ